ncbi:MAG TPA: hypothetical protein VFO05_10520 [Candidatus Limnocylindrales bacterium]|nr:hypothetical protein [Candidatus Limnocylindrales bacterium]
MSITEPGGLKSVTLTWTDPQGVPHNKPMGPSRSGWAAILNENTDMLFSGNTYTLRVTAVDNAGNRGTSGQGSFFVDFCIT